MILWVRKTLSLPWVLLMFGLGWYLDVTGSDSHILVEFLRIFEEKSQKKENWASSLRHGEGCPIVAKQDGKKCHPWVHCSEATLHRAEGTVHRGINFRILFRKPRIRTPIV